MLKGACLCSKVLFHLDQFQTGDDVTLRVIVGLAIRVDKP
jgi:hypothetical protein